MPFRKSLRLRASGFSLLEVLIAIVVLSFGLLGIAGLQLTALQNNRDARLQSTAVNLAREIAELMRGNKDVALLKGAANPYLGDFTSTPAQASYCLAAGNHCATNADVAASELTDWLARVQSELPGARVRICSDSSPYDANGLPRWDCTANAAGLIVIKIGWTRRSTNASHTDDTRLLRANDNAPSIVVPVTPGLA